MRNKDHTLVALTSALREANEKGVTSRSRIIYWALQYGRSLDTDRKSIEEMLDTPLSKTFTK